MTHESLHSGPSKAELYRQREGAIDLSGLTTEEVIRLGRGLGAERRERLNRREITGADTLIDILGVAIRRKASGLPREEAVQFVRDLAGDPDNRYIRPLAAYAVPVIAPYDYELARDTIIKLAVDRDGEYCGAVYEARDEMWDNLPPEQQADFSTQYVEHWRAALLPGFPVLGSPPAE